MATQENRSMVSETSICNQALLWLGSKAVTSLADDSKEARWMKNNYPFVRDAVIEERMWTFATSRGTSTVADMDEWGEMYAHPIPEGWLGVYRVYRENMEPDTTWRLENLKILSENPTIRFWGLRRISDTGAFSPLFVQALAARLAADAAIPLTENRQLQADMWNIYRVKLAEAAARDGMQGANDELVSDTLIRARAY